MDLPLISAQSQPKTALLRSLNTGIFKSYNAFALAYFFTSVLANYLLGHNLIYVKCHKYSTLILICLVIPAVLNFGIGYTRSQGSSQNLR